MALQYDAVQLVLGVFCETSFIRTLAVQLGGIDASESDAKVATKDLGKSWKLHCTRVAVVTGREHDRYIRVIICVNKHAMNFC